MLSRKNISDVGLYVAASNFSQLANTIVSIGLRFIIPIEFFGAVSLVNAYRSNLFQINSPVCNIADIQVPLALERPEYVRRVEEESYRYLFWSSILQVLVLVFLGALYSDTALISICFYVAAIAVPFCEYQRYDRILLKAHRSFSTIFRASILTTVLQMAVLVSGSILQGGYGYIFSVFLMNIAGWYIFSRCVRRQRAVLFSILGNVRELGKLLLGFGLAYTGYRVLLNACVSLDRVILEALTGAAILGIYSFSVNLSNLIRGLPRSLVGAILPIFLASTVGTSQQLRTQNVVLYQRIVLTFTFLIVIAASFAVEIFIPKFLPAYGASVLPAQILFMAVVAQNACAPLVADCLAEERGTELLWGGVAALVALLLVAPFVGEEYTLSGVATAVLLAFIANFFVLAWKNRNGNGGILLWRGMLVLAALVTTAITRYVIGWQHAVVISSVFVVLMSVDFYLDIRRYRLKIKAVTHS